jgi:hypothetical protein
MTPERRCGPVFKALRVQREPLDQTDLKDDVNVILGGGGGNFYKWTARWGYM